jgi:hypothetical protein
MGLEFRVPVAHMAPTNGGMSYRVLTPVFSGCPRASLDVLHELTVQQCGSRAGTRAVLRWFARSSLIEPEDVRGVLAWENSGFSLDGAVRVGAHDRAAGRRWRSSWLDHCMSGL